MIVSCNSYGQIPSYKEIPKQYLSAISVTQKQRDSIKNTIVNPYYLVNALPKGYVKTGNRDYTQEIQQALLKYRNVVFPDFPILINEKGLTVSSNSNLYFENSSKLILKANNLTHYEILRIHDVDNVNVFFANIQGDKVSHIGKDGEWGMGISVRGVSNIMLYSPKVKECWGDGIYLGVSPVTNNINNYNVKIVKGVIDNNRRNGISIISAENLNVSQMILANTLGTPPMAGIDIEPDASTDIIRNLYFNDITSFNNTTHGFLFVLGRLYGKQSNLGKIKLNNFKAVNEYLGISFKLGSEKNMDLKPVGDIEITNAKFENIARQEYLSYDENARNNIQVKIKVKNNEEVNKYNRFFNNSQKIIVTK